MLMRLLRWLLFSVVVVVAVMLVAPLLARSSGRVATFPVFLLPAASSSWSLVGAPSVSAAFMNQVLTAYHSPAVGLGDRLYADGLRTGIDPVYALAFFFEESDFGTQGVARVTHSLGNIACSAGYVCVQGFRSYASWQAGADDWFHLLLTVYLPAGCRTLATVVPKYAPPSANNTARYIATVKAAVSAWRAGRVLV
jgi:hypothetical protein